MNGRRMTFSFFKYKVAEVEEEVFEAEAGKICVI